MMTDYLLVVIVEKVNIPPTENAELFMNEDIIKSIDRLLSKRIGDHGT